jgi:hypothetical protein
MKIKLLIVIIGLIVLGGCSSPLPEIKKVEIEAKPIYENNLRINSKQVYCWVNRMPGQKPRFNVTGELNIFEASDFNLKDVTIKKVFVIQNDVLVYQFTPKIDLNIDKNVKTIIFSTVKGLLLTMNLDSKKPVNIKILLSDSAKETEYLIENVAIEEVY